MLGPANKDTGCDRWEGTSYGPLGQHCGQAAAQWSKDSPRPLRGYQHLWRFLSSKAYVSILNNILAPRAGIYHDFELNADSTFLHSKIPRIPPQDDPLQPYARRYDLTLPKQFVLNMNTV